MSTPVNETRETVSRVSVTLVTVSLMMLSVNAMAADALSLPDPIMTPGASDPKVTLQSICNDTTKTRRIRTTTLCDRAFAGYRIPPSERYEYECDHLIPLAIGGANVVANLWPQPNLEAETKDACEREMQRRVCHGLITIAKAQEAFSEDWVAACRR